MTDYEKSTRELLSKLQSLPENVQERIGYMIEGAALLAESSAGKETMPRKSE